MSRLKMSRQEFKQFKEDLEAEVEELGKKERYTITVTCRYFDTEKERHRIKTEVNDIAYTPEQVIERLEHAIDYMKTGIKLRDMFKP